MLDHDLSAGGGAPSATHQVSKRRTRASTIVYLVLTALIGWFVARTQGSHGPSAADGSLTGHFAGEVVGGGLGLLLVAYAMAALVVGWTRSTRRLMPGTAFAFAALHLLAHVGALPQPVRGHREPEMQFITMQRLADAPVPVRVAQDGRPVAGPEARLEWVWRKLLEDISAPLE